MPETRHPRALHRRRTTGAASHALRSVRLLQHDVGRLPQCAQRGQVPPAVSGLVSRRHRPVGALLARAAASGPQHPARDDRAAATDLRAGHQNSGAQRGRGETTATDWWVNFSLT